MRFIGSSKVAVRSRPVVVFAAGRPSPYDDHVSDRLLDLRPGPLVIVSSA